jgi:large subunit ribosomal protein L4
VRQTLRAATAAERVLVVLARHEEVAWLSLRNVASVHTVAVDQLNAYDVLVNDEVVFTRAALDAFVAGRGAAATTPAEVAPDAGGVAAGDVAADAAPTVASTEEEDA